MFTCGAMAAMLETYYISKGYFIVPVVRFSQRGRVTLSAVSREIDCKPKIESCSLNFSRLIAHLLRICKFMKLRVSNRPYL